ncbi:uncharacterized protein LOC107204320 isoform X1 [Parus major]|uniref:uncharacterized protein LOC107204320 isoform X1 n=1 Tax=Parus major TaxID=9157 RepID=UPI0007715EC0|nr:uncharacterized protein LOC107204320 isoform X1 [Parus major]
MNTPNVSDSSNRNTWNTGNDFGSTRTEMSDTPDISGFTRGAMWSTYNISGSRGIESQHTHNVSGNRGTEVLEGQHEDTDPSKMTAQSSRHTSDTSQKPSAYEDQTSNVKEMPEIMDEIINKYKKETLQMMEEVNNKQKEEIFEMMKEMDNKNTKERDEFLKAMDNKIIWKNDEIRSFFDTIYTHLLDCHNRALPGRAIQIHEEKEENKMLKEKIKKLEARIQELLAKAIVMHQHSEDINDPSRLSAVLDRYELLRLREWEKVRSSMSHRWTYKEGSRAIKKLFDACEKDIQQRTDAIIKGFDIPQENNTLTKVMMQDIMKLLRQRYRENSALYKIVQEAAINTGSGNETQFLLQCCQIYCLLLLQDPPVKADWKMDIQYLEHVDRKDAVYWKKTSFLWPIMKCGEKIIVKGVVWD